MNKKIKCLIFDLDGTILHSGPDLFNSLNFSLKKQNLLSIPEKVIGSLVGGGAKVMIEKAFRYLELDIKKYKIDQMVSDFLDFYFENCDKRSSIYPTVISTLKNLKSKYTICLCTNKKQYLTDKILKSYEIEKYFDYILGSNSELKLKPDSEMLNFILKKFNLNPENCMMIGDSHNDIIPANKLKMLSVYVTYGYGKFDDNLEVDYKIDKFSEITQILQF